LQAIDYVHSDPLDATAVKRPVTAI
jgi:hypothetical protein